MMEEIQKICDVKFCLLVVIDKDDRGGGLTRFWERHGWKLVAGNEYHKFFGVEEVDSILVKGLSE